jgi:predicted nuclease of predicted toxin-antitoxin system
MLFLVDAQLPPSLAEALRQCGHEAVHAGEIGMLAARDADLWSEAISRSATLVTKDRDFALLRTARQSGPSILWIRIGNASNRVLIDSVVTALPKVIAAFGRGDMLIELSR